MLDTYRDLQYDPSDRIHWIKWFDPVKVQWLFRRYKIVEGKRVYYD